MAACRSTLCRPRSCRGGHGPLWWLTNNSVDLMDGVKTMGTYQIDGIGSRPEHAGRGSVLGSLIVAGSLDMHAGAVRAECGHRSGPEAAHRRRRVQRVAVTVEQSSGFKLSKLYSGPKGALLPAVGTEMGSHRVPAWNQDDNQASRRRCAIKLTRGARRVAPMIRALRWSRMCRVRSPWSSSAMEVTT
jgi:hypothetical protein